MNLRTLSSVIFTCLIFHLTSAGCTTSGGDTPKNQPIAQRVKFRAPSTASPSVAPGLTATSESGETVSVYFGNLHSHTSYSDGSGKPREAYDYARNTAHLDFLAITEHNHSAADGSGDRKDGILIAKDPTLYRGKPTSLVESANAANKDDQFVAIYGQEFSSISSGNHVNVFHVDDWIDDSVVHNGNFKELTDWFKTHPDHDGNAPICQFNHPKLNSNAGKQYGRDDFGGTVKQWREAWANHARTIEVLNGPAMTKTHGDPAEKAESDYFEMLSRGFHLAPSADQDNHYKTWGTATDARTGVICKRLTRGEVLDAIRRRHVYATEDKNLSVVFWVNGNLCGDRIAVPADKKLKIEYSIFDDDEPDLQYKIEVLSDDLGGSSTPDVIEELTVSPTPANGTTGSIQDIECTGATQFILFRVTQIDDDGHDDHAWTAPIWFDKDAPGGGPTPGLAMAMPADVADNDVARALAGPQSDLYHISDQCPDIKRVPNPLKGLDAMRGRHVHKNCGPRTGGAPHASAIAAPAAGGVAPANASNNATALLRSARDAMRAEVADLQKLGRALTDAEVKRVKALNSGVESLDATLKALDAAPPP